MKDNLASFLIAWHSYGLETMLLRWQGMYIAQIHKSKFKLFWILIILVS